MSFKRNRQIWADKKFADLVENIHIKTGTPKVVITKMIADSVGLSEEFNTIIRIKKRRRRT